MSIYEFDNMFDLLWKNMLDRTNSFNLLTEKINYPVDIYETETGITFELAVVGIDSKDIDIEVENDTLRVKHSTENHKDSTKKYLHRSISKKAFDYSWKVSSKFDLSGLTATVDRGLLTIEVPQTKKNESKKLSFKPQTKTLLEVKA